MTPAIRHLSIKLFYHMSNVLSSVLTAFHSIPLRRHTLSSLMRRRTISVEVIIFLEENAWKKWGKDK